MSQCCALKLSEQLVQLSSKLICLRATFSCPFTPFSSFINLIAHSLISLRLSPSPVLWPIPEGGIVKVSQPISVQLMYCPLPDMTSIVSRRTSPPCSRAAGQSEAGWCVWKRWMDRWQWSRLHWCILWFIPFPQVDRPHFEEGIKYELSFKDMSWRRDSGKSELSWGFLMMMTRHRSTNKNNTYNRISWPQSFFPRTKKSMWFSLSVWFFFFFFYDTV